MQRHGPPNQLFCSFRDNAEEQKESWTRNPDAATSDWAQKSALRDQFPLPALFVGHGVELGTGDSSDRSHGKSLLYYGSIAQSPVNRSVHRDTHRRGRDAVRHNFERAG